MAAEIGGKVFKTIGVVNHPEWANKEVPIYGLFMKERN